MVIANGRLNPLPWVEDQRRLLIYSISSSEMFLQDPTVWMGSEPAGVYLDLVNTASSPRILFV
jgi:hypothetical protein